MKNCLLLLSLATISFACEKEYMHTDIEGTTWKVERIISTLDQQTSIFPSTLADYTISFDAEGRIKINGGCNYSFGEYTIDENVIVFSAVGLGTYLHCGELTNWETRIIRALNVKPPTTYGWMASTYRLSSRELIIQNKNESMVLSRVR